jgi:hypothetical protein
MPLVTTNARSRTSPAMPSSRRRERCTVRLGRADPMESRSPMLTDRFGITWVLDVAAQHANA